MMAIKIVVVEDDLDICEILKFNLELEDYKVKVFQNGELALDYLLDHPPDLLILDLNKGNYMLNTRMWDIELNREEKIRN